MGSTNDVAAFYVMVQKLIWHVSTIAGWKQGPVAVLGKKINNLKDPVFGQPPRLVRMYYSKEDGIQTKACAANGHG
jgi:hypothetical protein